LSAKRFTGPNNQFWALYMRQVGRVSLARGDSWQGGDVFKVPQDKIVVTKCGSMTR